MTIDPYITQSQLDKALSAVVPPVDMSIEQSLLGANVLIRTVAFYYTGTVVKMTKDWVLLADAAWIADTGRWGDALKNGTLSEVEPYPNKCWVAVGSIVDIAPWDHQLPREQK